MPEREQTLDQAQDVDLKKLKRVELLEMMLSLSEENERLRKENSKLQIRLDNRTLEIENAGSIAEASLQITEIFQAAQEAADCYLENIARLASQSQNPAMSQSPINHRAGTEARTPQMRVPRAETG